MKIILFYFAILADKKATVKIQHLQPHTTKKL